MNKKIMFISIISIMIAMLVSITSILNIVSLRNKYIETVAENNAIVSTGVVNSLEYSLKYGKSLENFYGIDDLLIEVKDICPYVDKVYIVDDSEEIRYEKKFKEDTTNKIEDISEYFNKLINLDERYQYWIDQNYQNILIGIRDKDGVTIGALGINYNNELLNNEFKPIANKLIISTIIPILMGIIIFIILFEIIKHNFEFKRLLAIIIPIIICSSIACGVLSYSIYKNAYTDLTLQTADMFYKKIEMDIHKVTDKGIKLEEIVGFESYFSEMIAETDQIEHVALTDHKATDDYIYYSLVKNRNFIKIKKSKQFITDKLKDIIIEIIVSIITAILIAAEVMFFIISIFTHITELSKDKKRTVYKDIDKDVLPVGIVRGLFFFFAMFQYMSMAFVPVVMAEIYRPIFGLPYEIVMCIPITAQIFVSIFSAWICGKIITKRGWRPVAMFGMTFMIIGAIMASFSSEPILFICAQIVLGFGLGCAKTSFDIFGVIVPSSKNIEEYTSSSNAGLIVGMSCSAAIGGIIASVVGFSGAFLVMAGFGVFVIVLTNIFAKNIIQPAPKIKEDHKQKEKQQFDFRFMSYILFMVIPYFFISMYLDYFFPVFADSKGITTATIGHVFLLYGIATSYIGAYLCRFLTKHIKNIVLMSTLLLSLGIFMGTFAMSDTLILAIAFVLYIAVVDGIMPSLQYRFVFSLGTSKRLGISYALGIEGAFSSAIRGIAPLVFGLAMMYGNKGLMVSGIVVIICAIVFFILNSKERNEEICEES